MKINTELEEAISRLTPSRHYSLSVKEAIIRSALTGEKSFESIRREYNIAGASTIQKWLAKLSLPIPIHAKRKVPIYSIAFKKQVVFEVQCGAISAEQAQKNYKMV